MLTFNNLIFSYLKFKYSVMLSVPIIKKIIMRLKIIKSYLNWCSISKVYKPIGKCILNLFIYYITFFFFMLSHTYTYFMLSHKYTYIHSVGSRRIFNFCKYVVFCKYNHHTDTFILFKYSRIDKQ